VIEPFAAPSNNDWNDEFVASDQLISRLYRADEQTILDVIAPLPPRQRVSLAAFCYRRSHLHSVGLTIAATCEQMTLMQVLGTAVGTVLFSQSRQRRARVERAPGVHRPRITLARAQVDRSQFELEQSDDTEAVSEDELQPSTDLRAADPLPRPAAVGTATQNASSTQPWRIELRRVRG